MTDDQNQAFQEAESAAHGNVAALFERVADSIGLHAGAGAVFGEPVKRDRVTVIPVAQMIIGTGAGGGALTRPLGYIEVTDAGADFRPIRQPWQDAGLVVSAAFAVLLLAKAVRTLVRG